MNRGILSAISALLLSICCCGRLFAQETLNIALLQQGNVYLAARPVQQATPELAALLLMQGPSLAEAAAGVTTSIPDTWTLQSVHVQDGYVVVNLGGIPEGTLYDDNLIDDVITQFSWTARAFDLGSHLLVGGEPISILRYPQPEIQPKSEPAPAEEPVPSGPLSGKKICLSAGHGYYWTGSSWVTQRPVYCAPLSNEDFHNVDHAIMLKAFLEADGATVIDTREMNQNRGNSPYAGRPWWQLASPPYLYDKGYPASVYAPLTGAVPGTPGTNQTVEDRRTRPTASNYESANLFVSLHTNGLNGNCYGLGCVTGLEVYYDTTQVNQLGAQSRQFATTVQNQCYSAITNSWGPWTCRNNCTPRSEAFTEIHFPNVPACLVEFGFHDSCDLDGLYLRDPLFTSAGMYGIYTAICQYFGVSPSYSEYSAEYVSDTIPTTVTRGETRQVSITFRNRGVAWNENHKFRLGAVGDSDPFAPSRHHISGNVMPGKLYTFTFNMTFPTEGTFVTDWRMLREGKRWFGDTINKTVRVLAGSDTIPPSIPQNLRVFAATQTSISIAWDASTDNQAVAGYKVYRNGSVVHSTSNTHYNDTGLSSNTTYTYQVEAYDLSSNNSGRSAPLAAQTLAGLISDGFDGNLNNWILDPVNGSTPLTYTTAQNHGALPGAGSAWVKNDGVAHYMYRWLDTNAKSLTSGGYKTGLFTGWLYDTAGPTGSIRTGLRVYSYDASGTARVIYWVGVYAAQDQTHYIGAIHNGSTWVYYSLGSRSTGWHKLQIEILPFTGSNDVKFYLDGNLAATGSQPAAAATANLKRLYIGFNYGSNGDVYFDDITFDSPTPAAPSNLAGSALSTTAIRWSFADNAVNEIGTRIYDASTKKAERETADATYVDESGLIPNTIYNRSAKAYAGVLESSHSAMGSGCTLSVPPSNATVMSSKPAGVWQNANPFQFAAVGGFGTGKVAYYAAVWDTSPTHTWNGQESTWDSPVTDRIAAANANPYYFHVRGFNHYNEPNGTLTLGPYYFDDTPPSTPVVNDDGDTTTVLDSLHAKWSAADAESDIETYQYAIGTAPGGTDVVGWTNPSPQNATEITHAGLTLVPGRIYYISVKARNAAQLWSQVGSSNGILAQSSVTSIYEAKGLPDNAEVTIKGAVVSAVFDGAFYVQESGRTGGIRVENAAAVQLGDVVSVTGEMRTSGGERYVAASSVVPD